MLPKSKNSSMSDQDWHWYQLWCQAKDCSASDIAGFEDQLANGIENMDLRVQLLAYYYRRAMREDKSQLEENNLLRHVCWFVRNHPAFNEHVGHSISITALFFKPKNFATVRQAWQEQVDKNSGDGNIVGNAGRFIVWNDFETGSKLLEQAQKLQPAGQWLGLLVIHCSDRVSRALPMYANERREKVLDVGLRALSVEGDRAPFLTAEFVADAALKLARYEVVERCAKFLCNEKFENLRHLGKIYLALIALHKGDKEAALEIVRTARSHFERPEKIYDVATELFARGEHEAIISMVKNLKGKVKKSDRERWLLQLERGEQPEFYS